MAEKIKFGVEKAKRPTIPALSRATVKEESNVPKLSANSSKEAKRERVRDEMAKFKRGELRSGSKTGPVVKSREQAIAISLSEAGESRKTKSRKSSRGSGRR